MRDNSNSQRDLAPHPGGRPALDRHSLLGLLRSLLIYYGRPFRVRRLSNLYAAFVGSGELAFDLGAHVGVHLQALLRLGAHVVAVEPQPLFHAFLQRIWGRHPRVRLLPFAVGAQSGIGEMWISRRTPTVSSTSAAWVGRVAAGPEFSRVRWDRRTPVRLTTLDALISEFGRPQFCKIDVEGSELEVLEGLSRSLPALSFEYQARARVAAQGAIARLRLLGAYEFNWSAGERMRLERRIWVQADEAEAWLRALPASAGSGDLFARLSSPREPSG